jgi:flagellum-specific peptidoglycan hydrolase FlgJ
MEQTTFANQSDFAHRVAAEVRKIAPEFGLPASPTDLLVTAHAALSSGFGRKVFENNLFGQKVGRQRIFLKPANIRGWHGASFNARTRERTDKDEPIATRADFRAYDSLADSVTDYLRWLSSLKRYRDTSFRKLKAGSNDYMNQLGIDGWYTGGEDTRKRLTDEWRALMLQIAGLLGESPPTAAEDDRDDGSGAALMLLLVGLALAAAT